MNKEKSCNTCKWSQVNNPASVICWRNPESPTYMLDNGTDPCAYKYWAPIESEWKPSEMNSLALESMEKKMPIYGYSVYDKNLYCGYVVTIGNRYTIDHGGYGYITAEEIYREKPQTWKDLTPEEVKEHLFEDVWMWNENCGNIIKPAKEKLCGFKPLLDWPYVTYSGSYMHASLTKPEE